MKKIPLLGFLPGPLPIISPWPDAFVAADAGAPLLTVRSAPGLWSAYFGPHFMAAFGFN
ncbi:MAG: hypothetical protein AAB368_13990 [bacterium]